MVVEGGETMGWSFWKSFRVLGDFLRLNISTRGIGFSIGVKGARTSIGPRGVQLSLGRNGFRYRKTLKSASSTSVERQFAKNISEESTKKIVTISLLDPQKPTESLENAKRLLAGVNENFSQEAKDLWVTSARRECERLRSFDADGERRLIEAKEFLKKSSNTVEETDAKARIEHISHLRTKLHDAQSLLMEQIDKWCVAHKP
jgi:hypothetical protein